MNYFQLWKYYGTKNFIGKAWEKVIVDANRYKDPVITQSSVDRSAISNQKSLLKMTSSDRLPSVCYLIHYFFPDKTGGTERFVLNLAMEHKKHGGFVRVLTLSVQPKKHYSHCSNGILWRDYEIEGIPVTEFRYNKTPLGLYYKRIEPNDMQMNRFAQMILTREHFDVVHCAFPQPFSAFLRVCNQANIPYGITHTGFGAFCHYTTMIDRHGNLCTGSQCGKKCEKYCSSYGISDYSTRYKNAVEMMKKAAFMTAPAMFVAQYIEREWNQATVCVVPHGIGDEFSFSERSHQKRFMYAGTITRMKGIHFLIRAFIRLQDKSATLDIYGDGDKQYTRELQKLARVDPRIMFHLRVEPTHIPEIYRKHDVVVIPSIVPETYNYVVREGLCCGCLAVVANIGALPEAIDDGRNGFSFIPGDENSLLQALEKADRFDWNMYKNPKFSSIQQEYETYKTLYSNMTQTKTKF